MECFRFFAKLLIPGRYERRLKISFDFDTEVNRLGTSSLKWDRYQGRDVIPLWVADMDFLSPPAVIEALRARADHGVFGYSLPPSGLVDTVIDMLMQKYGWSVEPEWIIWLPGLVTGLNVMCRCAGRQGDEVITATPIYPPFLSAPGFSNKTLVKTPLVEYKGRYEFDFDHIEACVSPKTRLFLLCNPHNPTGRVYTSEELERLAVICDENDLILCSDEIHCDLVLDTHRKHMPVAALGQDFARRTVTLMAPSKTFNIPGLGCSFAVIPDNGLRKAFLKVMEGIVPHVNVLGYTAALAAYCDGWSWHNDLLDYLRENRGIVSQRIQGMAGLSMNHVEATYLAWIKVDDPGPSDPVRFFEHAGVGLSDGAYFGSPGFVRLNFGCPRSVLNNALARMEKALQGASFG
ncbi:MAG TPA: putative C-S lyase [Deltaproteobacteria bacterium]|nr:putative C-S lyase [Deltaproteobacteria bacterium]